jgi:hypothetical protein
VGKLMTGLEYIRKRFGELAHSPALYWALGCAIPSEDTKRVVKAEKANLSATSGTGAKPKTGGPRDKEFPNPCPRPKVSEAERLAQNLGPNVAKVAAGIRMPKR